MVRSFAKTFLAVALLAVAATSGEAVNPAAQMTLTTAPPAEAMNTAPISMGTPSPTTTPAPTKKKKKGKKCPSGLEAMPEDAVVEAASEAAIAAAGDASKNMTATVLAASPENESHEAPTVAIGGASAASSANTKSSGVETTGVGGGVVAALVVAGVMVVGVAAVAFRRTAEERRRAGTLRTPIEAFGQVDRTPAQVTVL